MKLPDGWENCCVDCMAGACCEGATEDGEKGENIGCDGCGRSLGELNGGGWNVN